MKPIICCLMSIFLASAVLITCKGESKSTAISDAETNGNKEIRIGISMPTLQEERWKKDQEIFKNELVKIGIKPKNIFIQSANGDEQRQVSQSENLITQGIDVLIIIPQNGDAIAPIVASAHEAGTKVIAVDRIINNADLDFYISFDAFYMGVRQAEYISKITHSGNWIMIGGAPTDPNATLIRKGQLSILQPYIDSGEINVVLDQAANYWNPEDALQYTEVGLTKMNNDVQVVFTSNDGCAGAAIEALEEQGLAGKVPVPGLDADLAAVQRIIKGTQSMTVYRKLSIMDKAAAQAAYILAKGGSAEDVGKATNLDLTVKNNGRKDVPAILLTSEDVMFAVDKNNYKVVIDDGWLNDDEIFAGVDKSLWPKWYSN